MNVFDSSNNMFFYDVIVMRLPLPFTATAVTTPLQAYTHKRARTYIFTDTHIFFVSIFDHSFLIRTWFLHPGKNLHQRKIPLLYVRM